MADVFGSGNKADKWTQKATEWINYLFNHKSDTLVAGENVTLTPDTTNHTVTISASGGGGGGTLTDVQVNGASVVSGTVANIEVSDVALTGSYTDLSNLPTIPTLLSQLTDDSTHRLVTDTQISTWNSAEQNVQSDWNQTDNSADDFIKNKPTLGTASAKDYTSSVTQNSTDLVTSGAVWNAIDNLPEPMVFKGTLGTGGTITSLPTASASNEGYTYKVITAGTYASQEAKVGDVFVSNGSAWVLIPAGDTDSDTWRSINVNGTEAIGSAISTGAVNFKNGTNVTISASGNDITISAQDTTYSDATQSTHGLMSTTDKTKLDGIASGAEVNVQSDWSQSDSTADDFIKNKPTIPTVNDGTLTITQNGTSKGTFTANQSGNATIELTDTTGYINQNETVLSTDKVPYVMRTSKTIANATPYIRETLVGGSIGWNQILQNGNFASTSGWTSYAGSLSASGNVLTQTKASGSASNTIGIYRSDVTTYVAGHKYFVTCDMKSSAALSNTIYLAVSNQSVSVKGGTLTTSFKTFYNIFNLAGVANNYINLYITGMTSYTSQLVLSYKNFMLVDLTLMLGTTIADYVYNMETNTAGAGIAKLREWGFFTKAYYPYNAGNVLSVQTTGHKVVGFNQWDEEWEVGQISTTTGENQTGTNVRSKNYIPILPNTTYYYNLTTNNATFFYDADKNFLSWASYNHSTFTTPQNAYYMRFYVAGAYGTTYNNDICINISYSSANQWDEQWEVGGLYWSNGQPDNSTTTRFRSKNYCDIVGGANYYKQNGPEVYVFLYDENKALINYVYEHSFTAPMNARYFKILNVTSGTYSNTIYIKLISDSPENGTYEPYKTNTYNVDDVVLRGIPKLDANNLLYYDGDTYSSDGHVIVKYSFVDLGSLSWNLAGSGATSRFEAQLPTAKMPNSQVVAANIICAKYPTYSWNDALVTGNKGICGLYLSANDIRIAVKDDSYTSTTFPTAISGVVLVYENTTQSDTTWHPFDNPQYVYSGGTEEYIDTREIPVPVGHITEYMGASDGKFYAPSSPLDDEKYMLTYRSGSIMWTKGNAWISLLDGHYDAYAQGQNIALPPNWTRLKISLECHSLDLGDSSKMIESEISRPTYEDGHYMSSGPCHMNFGLYNDLTCSVTLSESVFEGVTTYYVKMESVTLGQTATTDYHFWIYYQS